MERRNDVLPELRSMHFDDDEAVEALRSALWTRACSAHQDFASSDVAPLGRRETPPLEGGKAIAYHLPLACVKLRAEVGRA